MVDLDKMFLYFPPKKTPPNLKLKRRGGRIWNEIFTTGGGIPTGRYPPK